MFIALTGTIGSGKNTVAEYLVKEYGFSFSSGSDTIADEVRKRNLPVTRENMRAVANEMRSENGNALIDLTISKVASNSRALIGFLRTENEVKRLREIQSGAILIGITAPVESRYKRAVGRNEEKDQVTFEEFVRLEELEMFSDNPDEQHMQYCIDHADFIVHNEGTLAELFAKIDKMIHYIK